MIGKKKINLIKSLSYKKGRQNEQLFLVEGDKMVLEVLHSPLQVKELLATAHFLNENTRDASLAEKISVVTSDEIKRASLLMNPQNCLALCALPSSLKLPVKLTDISFYLDGIQDPGNLGTIIRICDWFGMEYLFCSMDTADAYNPKVIQASMGSFCRIKIIYTTFDEIAELASGSNIPVIGTFMEGESLYDAKLPAQAVIVMGNEGKGIRPDAAEKADIRITIPLLKSKKTGAESLNVSVAAGIIASEFRRHAE